MGEPAPEQADDGRPPRQLPYFSRVVTIACSVLAVGLAAFLTWPGGDSPLLQLDRPEESLERLTSTELDARAALPSAPPWERALHRLLSGSGDLLEEALGWYEEISETLDAPRAEIYRAILLAETGHPAPQDQALASAEWMRAAYAREPVDVEAGRAAIAEVRERLPEGWFADTLVARLAGRIGDDALREEAEAAIVTRGAATLGRLRLLAAGEALLLALGAAALAALLTGRAGAIVAGAPLPPPWPAAEGYALFVRSVAGLLGAGMAAGALLPPDPVALRLAGFLSGVPALWWSAHYLRARGPGTAAAFGLVAGRDRLLALLVAAAGIVGLGIVGDLALSGAARVLDLTVHWADGLPEELLWDSPWLIAAGTLDAVVWTPVVEEIVFRGILYGTLRRGTGAIPAALASAAIFAVAHGYGAAGFASALWSGIVWAVAYEKTRSLLPGMVAHGVNNLMVTVTYLYLYRPG